MAASRQDRRPEAGPPPRAVQLARGWSITRDADGRVVRSTEDLARDDIVTIAVADGLITSTVTDTNRTAP